MQKMYGLLQLVLLNCSMVVGAQNPPPPAVRSQPEVWREYVFAEGGFALQLPDDPSPKIRGLRLLGGKKRPAAFHNCLGAGFTIYTVRYADLEEESLDPQAVNRLFDDIRNERLAEMKTDAQAIKSQRDISLNGHLGRWLQLESKGGAVLRLKLFVVGRRLFLLEVNSAGENSPGASKAGIAYERSALKFLDSFRLLEPKDKK